MPDPSPNNLPVRRTPSPSQHERPANSCTLRRFGSPYAFHQRYGYATHFSESPVARSFALGVVSDASDAWAEFVGEVQGEADRERLHGSVRQMLARLTRLEAAFGEGAAGATFETYSQVRAAFVMARMQLDEIMDEVYGGTGPMPSATARTVDLSDTRRAPGGGSAGRAPHPGIDVTIPSPYDDDAPASPPAYPKVRPTSEPDETHPLLEGAAYRIGMVAGGIIGAAVIFSALAGR